MEKIYEYPKGNTRISLKSFKEFKALSEETQCFNATVYFDGKRVGTVSNRGGGGCNDYNSIDRKTIEAMSEFAESLDPVPSGFDDSFLDMNLDFLFSCLAARHGYVKDLKTSSRKKILGWDTEQKGIYEWSRPAKSNVPDWLKRLDEKFPEVIFWEIDPVLFIEKANM